MEVNQESQNLMALYLQIQQIEEAAKELSSKQPSRELSLSITKLQESRLWLSEALAIMGNFK